MSEKTNKVLKIFKENTKKIFFEKFSLMWGEIDDALFDIAKNSGDNNQQSEYFEAMRILRVEHKKIEEKFMERLLKNNESFFEFFNNDDSSETNMSETNMSETNMFYAKEELTLNEESAINKKRKKQNLIRGLSSISNTDISNTELFLVNDKDLEESLAIMSMSAKAETRSKIHLKTLHLRCMHFLKNTAITETELPNHPQNVANSFKHAIDGINIEIKPKIFLYKYFERAVMNEMPVLLENISEDLKNIGILPELKNPWLLKTHNASRNNFSKNIRKERIEEDGLFENYNYQDNSHQDSNYQDNKQENNIFKQKPIIENENEINLYKNFDNTINSNIKNKNILFELIRGYIGKSRILKEKIGQDVNNAPEVLTESTVVQNELNQDLSEHIFNEDEIYELFNDMGNIDNFKSKKVIPSNEIKDFIKKNQKLINKKLTGYDEDMIDIVSWLFEYIVQDKNLSASIQALLSRLQLQYLKVALLNKKLFASQQHPARMLLNLFAESAKSLSEKEIKKDPIYLEIERNVELIVKNQKINLSFFEEMYNNFLEFSTINKEKYKNFEKRVIEKQDGGERLYKARIYIAEQIKNLTENPGLPINFLLFFHRVWFNYLVLVTLKQGKNSKELRGGIDFIKVCVDYFNKFKNIKKDEKIKNWEEIKIKIEKGVTHGLKTLSFNGEDVSVISENFINIITNQNLKADLFINNKNSDKSKQQIETVKGQAAITENKQAKNIIIKACFEDLVKLGDINIPKINKYKIPEWLKVGTWFNYVWFKDYLNNKAEESGTNIAIKNHNIPNIENREENIERIKLSWFSYFTGECVFVNRRGLRVVSWNVENVLKNLEDGVIYCLDEEPLIDRALGSIVEKIKTINSDNADTVLIN